MKEVEEMDAELKGTKDPDTLRQLHDDIEFAAGLAHKRLVSQERAHKALRLQALLGLKNKFGA